MLRSSMRKFCWQLSTLGNIIDSVSAFVWLHSYGRMIRNKVIIFFPASDHVLEWTRRNYTFVVNVG